MRAEVCEDTALAALVKQSGQKLALLGGEKLMRTRMYTGLASLWEGLSKNVIEMLGGAPATVLVALAALAIGWATLALPTTILGQALTHRPDAWLDWACVASCLASAALVSTHIAEARYFGIPFWYGLLCPLGYAMGALIAFNGVRLRLSRRVSWKGRHYGPGAISLPHQS